VVDVPELVEVFVASRTEALSGASIVGWLASAFLRLFRGTAARAYVQIGRQFADLTQQYRAYSANLTRYFCLPILNYARFFHLSIGFFHSDVGNRQ
jgi:hypothetical protein